VERAPHRRCRAHPFYDLQGRQDEVPDGEVWVHCESGYRASIGASLMDCVGRDVVHIDDDWENAEPAGNPVIAS
jgi:hydroxyacylglutathione hydrolase